MFLHLVPSSAASVTSLVVCLLLVLAFEMTNGFHDTANAVATVIYTNSLPPTVAVVWSGIMNFLGVLLGGIAVAYALVELLPPDVLSPPDSSPAVPMLVAMFISACFWNLATWYFGLPNSSSHCIIGALIGIAIGNSLLAGEPGRGVDWSQVRTVLRGLAVSPVLGFVLAGGLYFLTRHLIRAPHLYEPPEKGAPPAWWIRALLILTCTGVSLSHGSNDGQKSIGLIMLTVIGLFPLTYALNPSAEPAIMHLEDDARDAIPLLERSGGEDKDRAIGAARHLAEYLGNRKQTAAAGIPGPTEQDPAPATGGTHPPNGEQKLVPPPERTSVRASVYGVIAGMTAVQHSKEANPEDKQKATAIHRNLSAAVEYAPWWVRLLSAFCLGVGTMFGYKRIVRTLGERVGRTHLTPAKGATSELVAAGLIGTAGLTGLPVSTTHVVTSGIAGTMVMGGEKEAGLEHGTVTRIVLAWVVTLPVTIAIAGGLFCLFEGFGK